MFPFFKDDYEGWKDSIRHNLSSNRCFHKVGWSMVELGRRGGRYGRGNPRTLGGQPHQADHSLGAQGPFKAPGQGQLLGGGREPDPSRGAAPSEYCLVPAMAEPGCTQSFRQGSEPLRAPRPALSAAQSPSTVQGGFQHQVTTRGPWERINMGPAAWASWTEQPGSGRHLVYEGRRGVHCAL